MEPPNLRIVPYAQGHSCENCKSFSIKDGKYHCGRFDLNVRTGNICDDCDFAGRPYKEVPKSVSTERPPLMHPRFVSIR